LTTHFLVVSFRLMLIAGLLGVSPCLAVENDSVHQLRERAHQNQLAERREWHTLLHYQPLLFSAKFKSLVDSDSFFLAPDGKTDPQAELDATLQHLFGTDRNIEEQNPVCSFPARYRWLKKTLDADRPITEPSCPRFRRWFEELQPHRVTLIFPAAYLNNPASMFGHTLLRIDRREQDLQTSLLAYTINYAANSRDQHGFLYAYNGLFGGYQGRFSIAPYYLRVKVYGDIENRDIWEYGLDLTGEEIDRLLNHVWEMRSAWFEYYFLDENCSYHLLSLLEAARPELRLTEMFFWWAIPSETVRAVAESGLVREVRFRPSRNTILRERSRRMDAGLQILAKRLTLGQLEPDSPEIMRLDPVHQAQVIELALDYAAYLRNERFGDAPQSAPAVSELLLARSRLDVPDQTPEVQPPEIWPGSGHKPARVGIGIGYEDSRYFLEIGAAPGYHDLFDPPGGFTPGSQVIALRGALRYYPQEHKVELERFDIVDIVSLAPWNRFLHPVSWKVDAGLTRKHLDPSDRLLLGRFNAGCGISREISSDTSAHAFAEGTLEFSDHFDNFVDPGIGPGLGLIHDFSNRWRTGLFFQWRYFVMDEPRNDLELIARNRFVLNEQSTLEIDLSWKRQFGHGFVGGTLNWRLYF
jgi:hypothetical protein